MRKFFNKNQRGIKRTSPGLLSWIYLHKTKHHYRKKKIQLPLHVKLTTFFSLLSIYLTHVFTLEAVL